jgi:RNA polymerase sigma-70 factor (ECF subfamily)
MNDGPTVDRNDSQLTDKALVSLAQRGERWAMDELLRRHSRTMERLASRMLRDSTDAEDVLQEAYVRAFQALPSFKGNSAFSTWLYRIVVNACLMHKRKKIPQFVSFDAPDSGAEARALDNATRLRPVTPLDILLRAERDARLRDAVGSLPESLRVPFVLTEMEDVSIHEGAKTLRVGVGAYRTRLYRARNRVRAALERVEAGERSVRAA